MKTQAIFQTASSAWRARVGQQLSPTTAEQNGDAFVQATAELLPPEPEINPGEGSTVRPPGGGSEGERGFLGPEPAPEPGETAGTSDEEWYSTAFVRAAPMPSSSGQSTVQGNETKSQASGGYDGVATSEEEADLDKVTRRVRKKIQDLIKAYREGRSYRDLADDFGKLALLLEFETNGGWKADRYLTTQREIVFMGGKGEAVVFAPDGIYRGQVEKMQANGGGTFEVSYKSLTKLTDTPAQDQQPPATEGPAPAGR